MKFSVLALNYEGTIADEGKLPPDIRAAIGEARTQGMGLKIMDHRASMIGAELQVQRVTAGGTLLICLLRDRRDKFSKSLK